jgi:peptidoglycan/xylan/chitin deacetylase (PgdA/CDA1 family)
VARFLGGATAAISLEFDDSMKSQVDNALPELNARKIRATFFINPGVTHYQPLKKKFQVDIPRAGHEIGNHTWKHSGARTVAEFESEVQKCAEVLERIYGRRPRLMSFAQPGGVPWEVKPAEEDPVFRQYRLIPAKNRHFFDEKEVKPISFVTAAQREGSWKRIGFHGVGGEWLSTSVPVLGELLDYLSRRSASVWTAPSIEVYKYIQERDAVRPMRLRDVSGAGFSLRVDCDPAKLDTYGLPVAALWDQDLTVEVEVPGSWRRFTVIQPGRLSRRDVVLTRGKRIARFEVRPNRGPVHIKRTG